MASRLPPLEDRFWMRVDKSGECWTWTGSRQPSGYGHFSRGSRGHVLAHRYSFELHHGPIPSGMVVCHRCDNPPCVRPDHLFIGTYKDNERDKYAKGRGLLGERANAARLTESQVREMRARRANEGVPFKQLAAEYGVHLRTAHSVVKGETWGHVK